MLWNVKNALNRDVEREHLNKILAEIRAGIDKTYSDIAALSNEQVDVHAVVGRMVQDNVEQGIDVTYNPTLKNLNFATKDFTITLTGDVTGQGRVESLGNVSIETSLGEGVVEEAPNDGSAYWRRALQWDQVPFAVEALADLVPPGFAVIDGDYVWHNRELEPPVAGITIANPDGVAGNPVFALANDLAAVEALSTTGMVARTGIELWATRTMQGPMSVVVTNGGGILGDPSFALVNDVTSPDPLSGYGANMAGVKGWYRPALFESTGLLSGGVLSVNAGDNTKYDIASAIVGSTDYTLNPAAPTRVVLQVGPFVAQSVPSLAVIATYVGIQMPGGTVVTQSSPFTAVQTRTIVPLGAVISNGTNLIAVNNLPNVIRAGINQVQDLMAALGPMNISGNVISANGAGMDINKSAGTIFKQGSNFANQPLNPHGLALAALSPVTFNYRLSNGTQFASTTTIDAANYESPLGTRTLVPGANNYSIQRISVFTSNLVRIQYGQASYSTMAAAEAALATEAFVTETNIAENGILICFLIVRDTATDLSDPAQAKFIPASKFGGPIGTGGTSITNTDALPEGLTNLYYTDLRARNAVLATTIVDGDTTHAPDGNAVFDAMALKEDKFDFSNTVFIGDSLGKYNGLVFDKVETKLQTTALAKAILFGQQLGIYAGNATPAITGSGIADAIATGSWAAATADAATNGNADVIAAVAALSAVNWATVKRLVFWMGTNDPDFGFLAFQVPLGAVTDTTGATFRGAVNHIVDVITTAHPHIRVEFITPGFRQNADTAVNAIGLRQVDYVDALVERAQGNKIPALDLYRLAGVNQYNWPEFLSDGVHNNTDGAVLLSDKIAGWMRDQSASTAMAVLATTIVNGDVTHAPTGDAVFDALALKANSASPVFTGNPTAPTPSVGDNDTSIATTAFVTAAAAEKIIDSIADADTTHAPSRNAVFDALALKANDADVVHDTGNETIAGTKTFSAASVHNAGLIAESVVNITGPAATLRGVTLSTALVGRWVIAASTAAESGSNAGSDLTVLSLTDAGALLGQPISVNRATGVITTSARPVFGTNTPWDNGNLTVTDGTWTPTLTNTTNVDSSVASVCNYERVNNTVHFWGRIDVDPTATATATVVGISLPVASNFANSHQAVGTIHTAATPFNNGPLLADVANDRLTANFVSQGTASAAYLFHGSYRIV